MRGSKTVAFADKKDIRPRSDEKESSDGAVNLNRSHGGVEMAAGVSVPIVSDCSGCLNAG